MLVARWQPEGDGTEQYLVGWMEQATNAAYKLARLGAAGNVLEGPVDVAARARWGQRDDPFRVHANRDVIWGWFDAANATTLQVARIRSGGSAQGARPSEGGRYRSPSVPVGGSVASSSTGGFTLR